jgi:hypothetical protein
MYRSRHPSAYRPSDAGRNEYVESPVAMEREFQKALERNRQRLVEQRERINARCLTRQIKGSSGTDGIHYLGDDFRTPFLDGSARLTRARLTRAIKRWSSEQFLFPGHLPLTFRETGRKGAPPSSVHYDSRHAGNKAHCSARIFL